MRGHLAILATLFTQHGLSHADVAKALGWDSPSTVGNKLRGERRTQIGELEQMAHLIGWSLAKLAEASDDLTLTKHPEAVTAATLVDGLPEDKRQLALDMLRAISGPSKSSQS